MVDELDQIASRGRRRWVLAIVFNILFWGMLGLVLFVWLTHQREDDIPSIIASRTVTIKPDFPGKIKMITVEPADQFTSGQVLFEIQDDSLLDDLRKTTESYQTVVRIIEQLESPAAKRDKLKNTNEKIKNTEDAIAKTSLTLIRLDKEREQKQADLLEAQTIYENAKESFDTGALPRSVLFGYQDRYLKAREALNTVDSQIAAAKQDMRAYQGDLLFFQQQLVDEKGKIDLDIADRVKERDGYEEEWIRLKKKQQGLRHRAPFDGFVVRRMKEADETVTPETEILELTTGKEIWVEAYFSPEAAVAVKAGDRLMVRYGSFPLFPVVVESVLLDTRVIPGVQPSMLTPLKNYRVVKLLFEDPTAAKKAGLVPGMRVTTVMQRSQGPLHMLGLDKLIRRGEPAGSAGQPPPPTPPPQGGPPNDRPTTGSTLPIEPLPDRATTTSG